MTAQHLEPTHGSATSTGALGPKRRAIAIAVLCILLLAAAGTIAFTTRTQTAKNVLTFGSVKMQVLETEQTASGEVAVPDGHEVEAASGKASRIVRFQNVGASTMYVRARPVMAVERADEAEVSQDQVGAVVEFGMDQSGAWQEGATAGGTTRCPLRQAQRATARRPARSWRASSLRATSTAWPAPAASSCSR